MSDLLPFVEAVYLATGTRPHLSTVIRWSTRGSAGIRLESRVVGARRLTTVAWVKQFVTDVTTAKNGSMVTMQSPRQADRAAQASASKLKSRLAKKQVK